MWDSYLFYFITHGVALLSVGSVGLVGNGLTLCLLCLRHKRTSTNCLLIALAACDAIYIVCAALLYGLTTVHHYTDCLTYYYYHIYPHITPCVYFTIRAAQTMSVYLTLAVTIERWIAVCHPLRAMALCTIPRAQACVAMAATLAILFNVPRFWEKKIKMFQKDNETLYTIGYNREFYTETYIKVYLHWLCLLVLYVVPFAVLAGLNAAIVRRVCRAHRQRALMSPGQRRDLRLATMLIPVVLTFLVCNLLPFVHTSIFVALGNKYYDLTYTSELVYVSNLLLTVNHSSNFIIYAIFGKKLRSSLQNMLGCWKKEKETA